jgi:hypothetical protein
VHVNPASRPIETGAPSTITRPPSPVLAACSPSNKRRVAVCTPFFKDVKLTWYVMSAIALPSDICRPHTIKLERSRTHKPLRKSSRFWYCLDTSPLCFFPGVTTSSSGASTFSAWADDGCFVMRLRSLHDVPILSCCCVDSLTRKRLLGCVVRTRNAIATNHSPAPGHKTFTDRVSRSRIARDRWT